MIVSNPMIHNIFTFFRKCNQNRLPSICYNIGNAWVNQRKRNCEKKRKNSRLKWEVIRTKYENDQAKAPMKNGDLTLSYRECLWCPIRNRHVILKHLEAVRRVGLGGCRPRPPSCNGDSGVLPPRNLEII